MLRPLWLAAAWSLLASPALADDWTTWRGVHQDGRSDETGLVERFGLDDHLLWSAPASGRGATVVFGDSLYVWGYEGSGADVNEFLERRDVATGAVTWHKTFRDFLSDVVYNRYAIGAPTVDPATGTIYLQSSAGEVMAFSPKGDILWTVPLQEAWGRMTFPNGRTGAPVVVGDLVIIHVVTAAWGLQGPARDRFYAFDKATGAAVWNSTPGVQPIDNSMSTALVTVRDGRVVLYAATGCGHLVAIDAATGDPLWRAPVSTAGVDGSPVLFGNLLIVAHDKENLDSTRTGRMVAYDVTGATTPQTDGTSPVLTSKVWQNDDVVGGSSSPVLVDGVVYQVTPQGDLMAIDAATGATLWKKSLGVDQLHASPLWADGRLYVPMRDGTFHVLKVGRDGAEEQVNIQLQGEALGSPSLADGRIFLLTTERLYAFGVPTPHKATTPIALDLPPAGPAARLRVRPAEVLLRPGDKVTLEVDLLDARGRVVGHTIAERAEAWIPPTAKVKSTMNAKFVAGALVAPADAGLTAGAWKVYAKGLEGTTRGRTVAGVPFAEDFEAIPVTETDPAGGTFGWPPLPWIGARFKWDVREIDGSHALAKTLDKVLFQRATTFIGHPDEKNYTLSADVMSHGDARQMSIVGLINQRYLIAVKANQRVLEVSSNQERVKESVPFEMKPDVWYREVTQVITNPDGSGVVRAKVWPRGEPEPAAWTIEVKQAQVHTHGAPGVYGFAPRSLHRVYIDNVSISRTEEAK